MGLIIVDTTILLYAVGEQHLHQDPCRRLVDAVGDGVEATTTVEVIQEFLHVRSRRRTRADASRLARFFAELLAPLVVPTLADLSQGMALFQHYPHLGAFDAILAATAIRQNALAFLSADAGFASVPGLVHVLPGTAAFDDLLA